MKRDELRPKLIRAFAWRGNPGTWWAADYTGWSRDAEILEALGPSLCALFPAATPSVVLGPESSGYLLGPLAAASSGAGFVAARKDPKPLADSDPWLTATTPLDYRARNLTLGFRKGLVFPTDRVLIVDDWADTGGQLLALKSLVTMSGADLVGIAVIVDALSDHAVRRRLGLRSLLHVRDLPY